MSDIYLFGDIGGHLDPFAEALERLGADTLEGRLPDGVEVVQVGDLVHRGPHSDGVVKMVDRFLNNSPDQWHQLVGNHEAMYVGGPEFGSSRDGEYVLLDSTLDTIEDWRYYGLLLRSLVIDSEKYGHLLVTHAGLSRDFWNAIGSPQSVMTTSDRLDNLFSEEFFAPGVMLGGYYTTPQGRIPAGPVWASPHTEVYPTWDEGDVPFGQVHGHSSLYNYWRGKWSVGGNMVKQMEVKKSFRQTKAVFDGKPFFGIDPQLGADDPHFAISPLRLVGQTRRPHGNLL